MLQDGERERERERGSWERKGKKVRTIRKLVHKIRRFEEWAFSSVPDFEELL
jgi:hypothetical protein